MKRAAGHELDVQVIDSRDRPVSGARVVINIRGFWSGGNLTEFTDRDGHAGFETAGHYERSRQLTIHVRGQRFGPYSIGGGAYTVQLN